MTNAIVRGRSWLIVAALIAVAASIAASTSAPSEATPGAWPIQAQYDITYHADNGDVLAVEHHEFRGESWRDWTDIVYAMEGASELAAAGLGEIKIVDGDRSWVGWLESLPKEQEDGYLPDALFDGDPTNKGRPMNRLGDWAGQHSPSYYFNARFGFEAPASDIQRNENVPTTRRAAVAREHGKPTDAVGAQRRVVAACEEEKLVLCEPRGLVVNQEVVFDRELRLPLVVDEVQPEQGGDPRVHRIVLNVRQID